MDTSALTALSKDEASSSRSARSMKMETRVVAPRVNCRRYGGLKIFICKKIFALAAARLNARYDVDLAAFFYSYNRNCLLDFSAEPRGSAFHHRTRRCTSVRASRCNFRARGSNRTTRHLIREILLPGNIGFPDNALTTRGSIS